MIDWLNKVFCVGGERDIYVPVPESQSSTSLRSPSEETTHVDTADCLEIEDLDDQSWELINRPADPLPNGIYEILINGITTLFL